MKRSADPSKTIPCSECSPGMMHPARVTYFTWLGQQLISVPDFPAWVCDICGRREYDTQALRQLKRILSPAVGLKLAKKPAARVEPAEKKPRGARPAAHDS